MVTARNIPVGTWQRLRYLVKSGQYLGIMSHYLLTLGHYFVVIQPLQAGNDSLQVVFIS